MLGRRRRRRRHLEIQVDAIQARELYLEFVPMDVDSDERHLDFKTKAPFRTLMQMISKKLKKKGL